MKYIKKFENNTDKDLWLIRTDEPYLEISIDKLNLPQKQKDYLLNNQYIKGEKKYYNDDNKLIKIKKIYVIDANKDIEHYYLWDPQNEEEIGLKDYIYRGEVEVTPEDIENWKIKNTANKYNL